MALPLLTLLQLSDEEEASAYFADLASTSQRPPLASGARRPTDAAGYVVRKSIHERGGAAPRHVLPVVVRGGVWEMIKAVARGKEGYWGLFKGAWLARMVRSHLDADAQDPSQAP